MKKKGAISIEMIIAIMLALLTLVLVASAFSGGMNSLWKKISGISSTIPAADVDAAKLSCNGYCNANLSYAFCCQKFAGSLEGKTCRDGPIYSTCNGIKCSSIRCE